MIRLLIVDDSPLMRRLLGGVFTAEGDFEIALARNGVEALEQLQAFKPDVITLDVNMPEMDGLACLDRIMLEHPCPVVMVSSLTEAGASVTLAALELGAVDFITKPDGAISLEIDTLAPRLVETVRAASRARLPSSLRLAERVRLRSGLAQPASAPAPRRRAPDSPARRRIKAAPGPWSRADRGLHRRTAGAGYRAVPAACRLSVAHRCRAAHAGLVHRSLGTPARQAVRSQRDGSSPADAAYPRHMSISARATRTSSSAFDRTGLSSWPLPRCRSTAGTRASTGWWRAPCSILRPNTWSEC